MKVVLLSFAHLHMGSYARHLHAHREVEIAGIFNEDSSFGRKMAEQYGTKCFETLEDALAVSSDAVVVCSANADHHRMVVAAAQAGKHVMCEKPLATTVSDARAMIDACKANGVKLMTAFPCRFIPAVERGKRIIEEGRLGKMLAIRATNHGSMPGGWFAQKDRAGGGAVMDHTVHVADLLRWMLGIEFVKVYAEVDNLYYPELSLDDVGQLTMTLSDGTFATLDTSWSRRKPFPFWGDVTLEFVGDKGVLEIDSFAQKIDVYSSVNDSVSWDYWGSDMDKALVANFVVMVAEDKPPFITGEDGLKALELAVAAYRSGETGQVVELPLED